MTPAAVAGVLGERGGGDREHGAGRREGGDTAGENLVHWDLQINVRHRNARTSRGAPSSVPHGERPGLNRA